MIPREVDSSLIDQIRSWRRHGDSVSTILNRLLTANYYLRAAEYLRIAFCSESLPNFELFPQDEHGRPLPGPVDRIFGAQIDEARPRWENAPPYPDLYRRRDRHAFRGVAAAYGASVLVGAADRRAAQFIGRAGYRPCPPALWGISRTEPPNAGLLAADPGDAKLGELLAHWQGGRTYDEYYAELRAAGFRVSSEASGYLIRDEANQAFYPGYYLEGIYSEEHSRNLWNGQRAQEIQFELNQRMGEDLVQYGPHDLLELRRQSGPAGKPLVPVLIFEPDGNVDVRLTITSLRAYYRYHYLPWDHLYGEVADD